jgi:CheY-like chemotaxis protein
MTTAPAPPVAILLAEDDPGDALLIEEALTERGIPKRLRVVEDGVAALAYLRDPREQRPDLVILDLNMPRMGGQQTLTEMKADPRLQSIPVVILTTSQAPTDVLRSYQNHASAFVSKPVNLDGFNDTVQAIDRFYFELATLPEH